MPRPSHIRVALLVTFLLGVLLIAGSCADDPSPEVAPTSTTAPPTTTAQSTVPPSVTSPSATVAPTATEAPTTTAAPSTTAVGSTAPPVEGDAAFALKQVVFGEGAYVAVQNNGPAAGSLEGLWLCQFPDYASLPDIEVGPGRTVALAVGGVLPDLLGVVAVVDLRDPIDPIRRESGELALYSTDVFSDPEAMVDYVEWGTPGHERSVVAVAAGIWPEGGFVTVPEETLALLAGDLPTEGPADWIAEIGG